MKAPTVHALVPRYGESEPCCVPCGADRQRSPFWCEINERMQPAPTNARVPEASVLPARVTCKRCLQAVRPAPLGNRFVDEAPYRAWRIGAYLGNPPLRVLSEEGRRVVREVQQITGAGLLRGVPHGGRDFYLAARVGTPQAAALPVARDRLLDLGFTCTLAEHGAARPPAGKPPPGETWEDRAARLNRRESVPLLRLTVLS